MQTTPWLWTVLSVEYRLSLFLDEIVFGKGLAMWLDMKRWTIECVKSSKSDDYTRL
uniref:Uncharacterized protein n=1 Tax=Kalanchoe fedtschenkoi TaxID=63787 RepID=A0A7N1A1Y3_KALFE